MPHAANVLVFGAGPVGLLTCAVAKGLGARQVIVVGMSPRSSRSNDVNLTFLVDLFADIQESRLKFAKEQGLAYDYYVSPKPNEGESKLDYPKRCAEEIRKQFGFDERGPGGIDLVVDCSGAEVCVQTGLHALRHGGTLVTVSLQSPLVGSCAKPLRISGWNGKSRYQHSCSHRSRQGIEYSW